MLSLQCSIGLHIQKLCVLSTATERRKDGSSAVQDVSHQKQMCTWSLFRITLQKIWRSFVPCALFYRETMIFFWTSYIV